MGLSVFIRGIVLVGVGFAVTCSDGVAAESLTLGVHPYLPAREIHQRFDPLAKYLSTVLSQPVVVRISRDYHEHITAIGRNEVDIAFLGPVSYVRLTDDYGLKPLLARLEVSGKPELVGVIIARQDSGISQLSDLKGKRFAFGDPDSTMSYVVPKRMMERAGVPQTALGHHAFLGAHRNVALAVLAGDYDAGAVKSEIFDEYATRGLRAVAKTRPVSEHVFVTRSTMSPSQVDVLRRALLDIRQSSEGPMLLRAINKQATNLVTATDANYAELRRLLGPN